MRSRLTIATRSSKLALTQASLVRSQLKKLYPLLEVELLPLKTTGDEVLDRPLRTIGGKGLFVKEIEEALLEKQADIAVHSMKDVPSEIPGELEVGIMLEREDPSDLLIYREFSPSVSAKHEERDFPNLPFQARLGTSSLRRKVQILKIRPDLQVMELRGNVDTRLRKLDQGEFDAIILATAGMNRLGIFPPCSEKLDFIPAPGQGAIGIEYRREDQELQQLLRPLHHEKTALAVVAERIVLKELEGNCEFPLGAHATLGEQQFYLQAFVSDREGKVFLEEKISGAKADSIFLAQKLVEKLLAKGARGILSQGV